MNQEFDNLSESYEDLLYDPLRERFAGDSLFFHVRKRDLIREHFAARGVNTRELSYLDVGCGKGELLSLLRNDFARVAGCDPSRKMMEDLGTSVQGRVQTDPVRIPFEDGEFDFVTAVCVFHHVPVEDRGKVLAEIRRVLKPGGTFSLIEHNPYNPVTRLIVSRTPVDANAILLSREEGGRRLQEAGFRLIDQPFFLFLPRTVYQKARRIERWLRAVPLGGQYAVFGTAS